MENGGVNGKKRISAEDVISKLKDDGDFDRLRLKIIRKLKENEELRNSIISVVKQSASMNQLGVENMKPRQLSDAIHQEVGDKVMSQISDGVWEIIKCGDGMKTEITETVQSVYNKLANPNGAEKGESSVHGEVMPPQRGLDNNETAAAPASEVADVLSDSEPNEPPGFFMPNLLQNNSSNHHQEEQLLEEVQPTAPNGKIPTEQNKESDHLLLAAEPDVGNNGPPGFFTAMKNEQLCDGGDEDPDVPPGFG